MDTKVKTATGTSLGERDPKRPSLNGLRQDPVLPWGQELPSLPPNSVLCFNNLQPLRSVSIPKNGFAQKSQCTTVLSP